MSEPRQLGIRSVDGLKSELHPLRVVKSDMQMKPPSGETKARNGFWKVIHLSNFCFFFTF